MIRISISLLVLFTTTLALASTVAVIDSGIDTRHQDLKEYIWRNPIDCSEDGIDDDRNGYKDDIYGWNFAENNNKIINYKFLDYFTPDVEKFFDLQTKSYLNTLSEEEETWMKLKVKERTFMKKVGTYANFMHGTHVTGIATKHMDSSKVFGIKLMATEVKNAFTFDKNNVSTENKDEYEEFFFKAGLTKIAKRQMDNLIKIAKYIDGQKADVANGSFGTGFPDAFKMVTKLFKGVFKKEPTRKEQFEYTSFYINKLLGYGKDLLTTAPKTLFVFAAGNDGLSNDRLPASPTNLRGDNVISVAATYNRKALANFSNYGVKYVDVAAPGVAINSTTPGDRHMMVSGTSQAAPYVAGVAAKIKEINRKLNPKGVKKIIMGTVDKKEFLKGKVKSGGVVNAERAIVAARLSLGTTVKDAISMSRYEVGDIDEGTNKSFKDEIQGDPSFVLPLKSEVLY